MKKINNLSKIKYLLSALILVSVIAMAGCGTDVQTDTDYAEVKIKSETTGDLAYNVPKNWKCTGEDEAYIVGTMTTYDAENDSLLEIQMVTFDQVKESAFGEFYESLDEFAAGEISSTKYMEGISNLTEENINIAGLDATSFVYDFTEDDKDPVRNRDLCFVIDDVFYHISISNITDENAGLYDMFINSIEIN